MQLMQLCKQMRTFQLGGYFISKLCLLSSHDTGQNTRNGTNSHNSSATEGFYCDTNSSKQ